MKQNEEEYRTPMRIRDPDGMIHSYWTDCDMWPKGGTMAPDDQPLTCLVCLVKEHETDEL